MLAIFIKNREEFGFSKPLQMNRRQKVSVHSSKHFAYLEVFPVFNFVTVFW